MIKVDRFDCVMVDKLVDHGDKLDGDKWDHYLNKCKTILEGVHDYSTLPTRRYSYLRHFSDRALNISVNDFEDVVEDVRDDLRLTHRLQKIDFYTELAEIFDTITSYRDITNILDDINDRLERGLYIIFNSLSRITKGLRDRDIETFLDKWTQRYSKFIQF